MIYPDSLNRTIEYLKKLPGVGEKSAERMALSLLEMSLDDINLLSDSLKDVKNKLHKCPNCGFLTENELCDICSDANKGLRDKNIICVLEDYKSVFAFEKTGKFNGVYHVLDGLISPIDGIDPEDINIAGLLRRIEELDNPELIIALKSSVEGKATTLYIKKILEDKNVTITRLSYGIPMGVEIDYLDELTLFNALNDRKPIS